MACHVTGAVTSGALSLYIMDNDLCYLKAEITPSQSLSNSHTAWVCIFRRTGVIENAGCTCMAGLGRACSHAGAVLWKIDYANRNNLSGLSCTDQSATWNSGTNRNVEPSLLKDTLFKKIKCNTDVVSITTSSPKQNFFQASSHMEFHEHLTSQGLSGFLSIPGTILQLTANAKISNNTPNLEIEEPPTPVHNHLNEHQLPFSCIPCSQFYKKYIAIEPSAIEDLANLTVGQSRSDMWIQCRRLRITASTASKVPKTEKGDPLKFLHTHIYKPFLGNFCTRHGMKSESVAIQQFSSKTGLKVDKCGMMVKAGDCWLSASPDGLIGASAMLEVKCPVPGKFETKKMDIIVKDGSYCLNPKGSRGYYTQIQLTLYCLDRSLCYFYVWVSREEDILIKVDYDQSFVCAMIRRLRTFYFKNMLPMLVDVHSKKLEIIQQIKDFFNW